MAPALNGSITRFATVHHSSRRITLHGAQWVKMRRGGAGLQKQVSVGRRQCAQARRHSMIEVATLQFFRDSAPPLAACYSRNVPCYLDRLLLGSVRWFHQRCNCQREISSNFCNHPPCRQPDWWGNGPALLRHVIVVLVRLIVSCPWALLCLFCPTADLQLRTCCAEFR